MQKIKAKLKNTPRDVQSLLVPCSASSVLNRDHYGLSVQSKVLGDNNLEGNPSQHRGSQSLRVSDIVYVLNWKYHVKNQATSNSSRR
jgi:hypothetical protein